MPHDLLISNARVITPSAGEGPRRGPGLGKLTVIDPGQVWIRNGLIQHVGTADTRDDLPKNLPMMDAAGRCLLPAFVDCHTHACWAGNRLDEWQQRLRGATYLQLLAAGGGIMSTVRAVREATPQQLADLLTPRLGAMLRHGTTTVEIKSGYGLSTSAELKMLRAIYDAGQCWPGRVYATACIGHALDPELPEEAFVERTIGETLPAISAEFPGITVDAYCEQGAWSTRDCLRLFDAARTAGHPIRVHADQFHELGIVAAASAGQFVSVDHLEASGLSTLQQLAESNVFGVMLPASGFHLDGRYADGRSFVDAGGALALATNFNPGSAPCYAMPMVLALAVRYLGLTIAEAIVAATINPALLLGRMDVGTIEPGKSADMVLLQFDDERLLAFEFGGNPLHTVICQGRIVFTG